jgi:hypothetical protein
MKGTAAVSWLWADYLRIVRFAFSTMQERISFLVEGGPRKFLFWIGIKRFWGCRFGSVWFIGLSLSFERPAHDLCLFATERPGLWVVFKIIERSSSPSIDERSVWVEL